jgi:AcrR family transcriptional regulator
VISPPLDHRAEVLRQAALDLIAERGSYEAIELSELLERAGVERTYFDRHFNARDECLLWASSLELRSFTASLWRAYDEQSNWRDGLRAAAYEMADVVDADPRFAVVSTVAIGYAGDFAQLERDAAVERMIEMVDLGRQEMADPAAVGRGPAEMVVGAIFQALRAGGAGDGELDPTNLVPQFMFMAVRPYLGEEAAQEELKLPRPGSPAAAETKRDTDQTQAHTDRLLPHMVPPVNASRRSDGGAGSGGLHRLPPGRHGLPREFVTQNQRDRIVAAMIRTVAERGYHATTVKEVGALAAISRTTFYEFFDSKEDCFFATYDIVAEFLTDTIAAAGAGEKPWPARVRAELSALLEALAANPDLVRFALTAPGFAGGEVAERQRQFLSSLREALTAGRPGNARKPTLTSEEALVGGLVALIAEKVDVGEGAELPELAPDLTELVLTPYLGRKRASQEARSEL